MQGVVNLFTNQFLFHENVTQVSHGNTMKQTFSVQIELFPSLPDNLTLMIYLAKCPPITLQHILDLLIKQFRNIQDVQACLVPKLQLA